MNQGYHQFGISALERMAEAPSFNRWMYECIQPFVTGDSIEIGSGIGNISAFFAAAGQPITLTDTDESEVAVLKQRFAAYPNVRDIWQMNIASPDFTKKYAHLAGRFDSVFLLNVLEHIEDDSLAVQHCRFLLKAGGTLLILVPAYKMLFSKMDELLGHYRRYTATSLCTVIAQNGFKIEKSFYFNALGMAGWWWNKIFSKAEISSGKMALFNRLVPVAKYIDKLCFNKWGLSTIVAAKKN